ncbi:unnamed protein product [Polarella glacialis]|uniref:Uncharacterized protein n=1 Tax=Polarella glacialis TaxID=89957 RepID=A0A813GGR7_POLGL|nr:unnamed protein product [Polarella glacialis]
MKIDPAANRLGIHEFFFKIYQVTYHVGLRTRLAAHLSSSLRPLTSGFNIVALDSCLGWQSLCLVVVQKPSVQLINSRRWVRATTRRFAMIILWLKWQGHANR